MASPVPSTTTVKSGRGLWAHGCLCLTLLSPGGGRACYVVADVVAARELTWIQIPPWHYLCRQEVVLIGVRFPFMMVSRVMALDGVRLPFMMVVLPTCFVDHSLLAVGLGARRVRAAGFSIHLEVTWWRWYLRWLQHGGSQF